MKMPFPDPFFEDDRLIIPKLQKSARCTHAMRNQCAQHPRKKGDGVQRPTLDQRHDHGLVQALNVRRVDGPAHPPISIEATVKQSDSETGDVDLPDLPNNHQGRADVHDQGGPDPDHNENQVQHTILDEKLLLRQHRGGEQAEGANCTNECLRTGIGGETQREDTAHTDINDDAHGGDDEHLFGLAPDDVKTPREKKVCNDALWELGQRQRSSPTKGEANLRLTEYPRKKLHTSRTDQLAIAL